jgi:hypothetical protein
MKERYLDSDSVLNRHEHQPERIQRAEHDGQSGPTQTLPPGAEASGHSSVAAGGMFWLALKKSSVRRSPSPERGERRDPARSWASISGQSTAKAPRQFRPSLVHHLSGWLPLHVNEIPRWSRSNYVRESDLLLRLYDQQPSVGIKPAPVGLLLLELSGL